MASSGLSLAQLNDYIAPGVECVRPVEGETAKGNGNAAREIQVEGKPNNGITNTGFNFNGFNSNGFNGFNGSGTTATTTSTTPGISSATTPGISTVEPPPVEPPPVEVKINLTDCLACSGCITTAESVLISLQSHKDIPNVLASNARAVASNPTDPYGAGYKRIVATISPQSRASIANKYGVTSRSVHARLVWWLKSMGIHEVWDLNRAREWALQEISREFVERLRANDEGTTDSIGNGAVAPHLDNERPPLPPLPLLASACPGFVCYLETTHPGYLPHLSSVRSPLSLLASILKSRFASEWGIHAKDIFHVSVQPCYDKKLEASRPELSPDGIRDTDCVVTTGELEVLWKEQGLAFPDDFQEAQLDAADPWYRPPTMALPLSASGGTLPYLLLFSLHQLFATPANPADLLAALESESGMKDFGNGVVLATQPGKNPDVRDWIILSSGGVEKLRFGQAYGFRNIQNTLRRLPPPPPSSSSPKPTTVRKLRAANKENQTYHFVEVMACPSGCLNGGGQLKPDATPENPSGATTPGWLEGVRLRYEEEMNSSAPGLEVEVDEGWYGLVGGEGSEEARARLRTVFRGVVKEGGETAGLREKW